MTHICVPDAEGFEELKTREVNSPRPCQSAPDLACVQLSPMPVVVDEHEFVAPLSSQEKAQ